MQPLPHFSGKKTLSLTDLETQREHIAALQNEVENDSTRKAARRAPTMFAYNNAADLPVDFVAASSTGEDMMTMSGDAPQSYISQPDIFGVINRVRALSMREINSGWGNREHIYRGDAALPRAHCPEGAIPSGVSGSGVVDELEASGVAVCGLMTALRWAPSGVDAPFIRYGVGYIPQSGDGGVMPPLANYLSSGAPAIGIVSSVTFASGVNIAKIVMGDIQMGAPDTTGASPQYTWGAVQGEICIARAEGTGVTTSVLPQGVPGATTPAWWRHGVLCLNLDALGGGGGGLDGLIDSQGNNVTWDNIGDYDNPPTWTLLSTTAFGSNQFMLYASKRTDASGKRFLSLFID